MIHTPVCDLLRIRHPIVLGGMAGGTSVPLVAELVALVAEKMGKALKPGRVLFTRDLPKTRSAKIMRRVIRRAISAGSPAIFHRSRTTALKAITKAR